MEKKTIEQIIEIEPKLQEVIDFAKLPEQKERYWFDIYHDCKMSFQCLVGWYCQKEELKNSKDYELFVSYIVDVIYANSICDSDDEITEG